MVDGVGKIINGVLEILIRIFHALVGLCDSLPMLTTIIIVAAGLFLIFNPKIYFEDCIAVSLSQAYIRQTLRHFLLLQVIPGTTVFTICFFNNILMIIGKDWLNIITEDNVHWFMIIPPLIFGGSFYLLGLYKKDKN